MILALSAYLVSAQETRVEANTCIKIESGTTLDVSSGGNLILKSDATGDASLIDLGSVVATAEVIVNGKSAGVRVAPPWKLDVSGLLKSGENQVEVLVYSCVLL